MPQGKMGYHVARASKVESPGDMAKPKLALLALDAADARLVQRLAAEGHLPTFARLFGSGLTVPIATPPAVLEGGIWPTLLTSLSPATHGMIYSRG